MSDSLQPHMEFSRSQRWSGKPFLLQDIFPTQESNQGLQHCRRILYQLCYQRRYKWQWKIKPRPNEASSSSVHLLSNKYSCLKDWSYLQFVETVQNWWQVPSFQKKYTSCSQRRWVNMWSLPQRCALCSKESGASILQEVAQSCITISLNLYQYMNMIF